MHVIKPYVYAYNINIEKISGAKCYSKERKKKPYNYTYINIKNRNKKHTPSEWLRH